MFGQLRTAHLPVEHDATVSMPELLRVLSGGLGNVRASEAPR
jgi:hypothetical protein